MSRSRFLGATGLKRRLCAAEAASGEIRVQVECMAPWQVGNVEHENVSWQGGRKRWMAKKPHNRGVTMNRWTIRTRRRGKTSGGRTR